ncbi:hypothetical protein HMPREF1979_01339 [Actinomyces johnsonii F0542]|uniref:Uncharacterized protein n=1 Tax=Actinomyces johnsonii F0542 TaxID=1321818 RepID=U1S0Z3_9ACTO|nr:hypothetical protein HMPREF1979_01339 [Actinomyces johnsonii F0542]
MVLWRIGGKGPSSLLRKARGRGQVGRHRPTGRKKDLPSGSPAMS